ncbi:hypothetical protein RIF29_30550 [Crotalaria pallida]|uniref:TRF2/HOY1 PH-like domain-containing protein n=1 Tax=Crotalaria pallida TaxID=3830 RepID=A0AAN9EN61_CROPI
MPLSPSTLSLSIDTLSLILSSTHRPQLWLAAAATSTRSASLISLISLTLVTTLMRIATATVTSRSDCHGKSHLYHKCLVSSIVMQAALDCKAVDACIYKDPSIDDPIEIVCLEEEHGVWRTKGPKSWEGCYYVYEVTVYHPSTLRVEKCYANDPYARGFAHDVRRTFLLNLDSDKLKPNGWDNMANETHYKSRYEGDLVAKCYFPKHKLVWEVLDGCLKNKIEIPWSDIMALKANYPEDAPGTLEVVLKVYSGLGTLPLTLPYSSFPSNSSELAHNYITNARNNRKLKFSVSAKQEKEETKKRNQSLFSN